jgi:hypothetical protein
MIGSKPPGAGALLNSRRDFTWTTHQVGLRFDEVDEVEEESSFEPSISMHVIQYELTIPFEELEVHLQHPQLRIFNGLSTRRLI